MKEVPQKNGFFPLLKVILSIGWVMVVGLWWFTCTVGYGFAALGSFVPSPMEIIFSPCFPLGLTLLTMQDSYFSPLFETWATWLIILPYFLIAAGGVYLIWKALDSIRDRISKRKGKIS